MRNDDQMLGTAELTVDEIEADKRAQAVRNIAGHPAITSAADLVDILATLGLNPKEGTYDADEDRTCDADEDRTCDDPDCECHKVRQ